jgi:signal transduction histidine kinase
MLSGGVGNLVEAQETERARIARELHDSLGQKVALLQINLDQLSNLESRSPFRAMESCHTGSVPPNRCASIESHRRHCTTS